MGAVLEPLSLLYGKDGFHAVPSKNALRLSFAPQCCVFQNKEPTLGAGHCHLEEILTILRPPPPLRVIVQTIYEG